MPALTAQNITSSAHLDRQADTFSKPGPLAALAGIVARPRATFTRLNHSQRAWTWVPALLMIVLLMVGTYVRGYADSYYFYESQLEYYAQHPEHSAGALQRVMAPAMTHLIRMAEGLVALLASWGFWIVGLYLLCIFTGQNGATWGVAARLALWGWLPYIIRELLQGVYRFLTHDPIFNPGLSGLLVDNTPPSLGDYTYISVPRITRMWSTALSYVDMYLFWQVALLVTGLVITTRLPRKKATLFVVILTLAWIAAQVGWDFSRYKY